MFLQAEDIPHREREVWLDSVIKILEEPQWAFLFSQTSRAEVDIAGHVMFEAQRRFVKGVLIVWLLRRGLSGSLIIRRLCLLPAA